MAGIEGYGLLARHYRVLFPRSVAQEGFFARLAAEGAVEPVLDVGCGAGEQLAWFSGRGVRGIGLEPDEAMFRELSAREWPGTNPELVRAGFDMLPGRWVGRAALVLCLGNTLPHLVGRDELHRGLAAMRATLAPGGRLALQTVNFDRVLRSGRGDFPAIERPLPGGGTVRLLREYDLGPAPERVLFRVRVEVAELTEEASWPLALVNRRELEKGLREAGFATATVSGDYDGSPWSPESPATVVVAAR